MLVRIWCPRCRLASLWTDEPQWFLATVCRCRDRCMARLLAESFTEARNPLPRANGGAALNYPKRARVGKTAEPSA